MADAATYETNTLGYKIKLKGPATVEEYDRMAGRVGACLEDAIDNTIYRGTLPEIHDGFGEELVKEFGEREVNKEATERAKTRSKTPDKVGDVKETWTRYHSRVTAGADEAKKKELQTLIQSVADRTPINPAPSARERGPGKPFLAKADSWLTLGDTELEGKITPALQAVPDFDLERDEAGKPDRQSLARLIERYVDTMV